MRFFFLSFFCLLNCIYQFGSSGLQQKIFQVHQNELIRMLTDFDLLADRLWSIWHSTRQSRGGLSCTVAYCLEHSHDYGLSTCNHATSFETIDQWQSWNDTNKLINYSNEFSCNKILFRHKFVKNFLFILFKIVIKLICTENTIFIQLSKVLQRQIVEFIMCLSSKYF